jgi:hypothetical protein
MAKPNAKAPVGQGGRFAALAKKTSPAIAAAAGRKKYGAKKMASMAAAGKRAAKQGMGYEC